MNYKEAENKNKLYLWVLTSLVDVLNLFPEFVLISIIWRTRESQHNDGPVSAAVLWDVGGGSLFLKWHVYRPLLDNKHQL